MNATGSQETGQPASPRSSRAAPADPAGAILDVPTLTHPPASSGIAQALGQEAPVLSDPEDFIHELTQSGLLEPAEAAVYRKRFSEAGEPWDARAVSRDLVRNGRLTPYQAAAVLQGKTRGLLIDGYMVLDRLGAGSMGIVLKAENRRLRRPVALKLLPPSLARNPSAVARFQREVKAAARLTHPNVVSIIDADEFRGLHFLVMEYVEGEDLSRVVRHQGPMEVPRAVDCIIQAARGLRAANDAQVVHRDIKPSNLLLDPGGTLKILDMGVARLALAEEAAGPDASLTESDVLVGTVDYMAPEQATNPKLADFRSDIYSLGCTLHFLLTGRPPYTGESFMARLLAHREMPIPALSEARPDVPGSLDRLFRRMLAKSPEDRVSSLDELITELEAALKETAAAPSPGPPTAPTDPRGPERPRIAGSRAFRLATAGSAIAVALAGGVWLARRWTQGDAPREVRLAHGVVSVGSGRGDAAPVKRAAPPTTTAPPPAVAPEPERPPSTPPAAEVVAARPKAPRKAVAFGLLRELRGHEGRVNAVAVSADGSRALSAGQDRSVRLWDAADGSPLLRLDHDGPVTCVAMTPDGRLGVSGSLDRTARVWDLRPGQGLGGRRLEGHGGAVFAVAFSPDRRLALSGGGDRTVRAWDVSTGRPDGPPMTHDSAVVALAVSPAGSVLTGCEDGTLWQWDLKSRQRLRRLPSAWPVLCLAVSADGHRALSGHPDGNLVLWDLDLGTEAGRMAEGGDYVRGAAFTPDGRRALVGSQGGGLVVWDVPGRRASRRLSPTSEGHPPAGQMDITITADGLHALTAGGDGVVRLWGLPTPEDAGRR